MLISLTVWTSTWFCVQTKPANANNLDLVQTVQRIYRENESYTESWRPSLTGMWGPSHSATASAPATAIKSAQDTARPAESLVSICVCVCVWVHVGDYKDTSTPCCQISQIFAIVILWGHCVKQVTATTSEIANDGSIEREETTPWERTRNYWIQLSFHFLQHLQSSLCHSYTWKLQKKLWWGKWSYAYSTKPMSENSEASSLASSVTICNHTNHNEECSEDLYWAFESCIFRPFKLIYDGAIHTPWTQTISKCCQI